MGNLSLIWGILGTFVGAILMLREMEIVLNQDSLLPAIAISLITLFYGIILYMLCLVSKSRIERRLVEQLEFCADLVLTEMLGFHV